jgi:hypothetical protein
MFQMMGTQLLAGCAVLLAVYDTVRFGRRLRVGDRGPRSFGAWLRDLFDVASGLG